MSKVQPLVHPKVHPKLLWKLRILHYFSKTWLKIWRKSWWSSLFWWNRSVLQIFLFSAHYIFCYWGKLPSHVWLERNCVYEPPPLFFFPWNTSDYSYLLKITIRVIFSVISSQNLKYEIKYPAMHGWWLSAGKISLSFKTMKNIKTADPVITMNSSYD